MATGNVGSGFKPGFSPEGLGGLKGPQTPGGTNGPGSAAGLANAEEFKRALGEAALGIGSGVNNPNLSNLANGLTQGVGSVAKANLSQAGVGALEKLKFSNHAIERMRSRGIAFAPEQMRDIEGAVSKAAAKGSKDTLVLAGDNALIVSVKNKTVVTVMDRAAMKDNVFTNIDSTVVV